MISGCNVVHIHGLIWLSYNNYFYKNINQDDVSDWSLSSDFGIIMLSLWAYICVHVHFYIVKLVWILCFNVLQLTHMMLKFVSCLKYTFYAPMDPETGIISLITTI